MDETSQDQITGKQLAVNTKTQTRSGVINLFRLQASHLMLSCMTCITNLRI